MNQKEKRNRIFKIFGNIIMVLALIFIVKKLMSYDIDYSQIFMKNNIYIYILLIVFYAGSVIVTSLPWRNMVYLITGEKIAFLEVAEVSTRANVMKYIPGNVFQYIGRNSLAVNKGLKHSEVAFSTILDVVVNLGSIFTLTIIFFFQTFIAWGKQYIKGYHIGILVTVIIVVLIVVLCFRKRIYTKYESVFKRVFCKEGIMTILKNILMYCFLGVLTTVIYMMVLMVLGNNVYGMETWMVMAGAILVSWILGFITPGAPGGIGVREAILIMLLGGIMNEEVIVLGVVVNRVISILGDLLAMTFMIIVNRAGGRKKHE